jgi:chemotaxis protein methyltransferase CheR
MSQSLSSAAFETFATVLKNRSGLVIGPDKLYLLETRLAPILKREHLRDLAALAEKLRSPANETLIRQVVEAMTTNESFFFRDDKPFVHFRNQALPRLLAARGTGSPLRIWSAASSSGQEAYSIAMILTECHASLGNRRIEIIGTDLARDQLSRARDGLYTQFEVQRGLPVQMLMRYFRKEEGNNWRISESIRGMVQFREWNLLTDLRPLGRFDVVFCRNVLIYFDQPTKTRVLEAGGAADARRWPAVSRRRGDGAGHHQPVCADACGTRRLRTGRIAGVIAGSGNRLTLRASAVHLTDQLRPTVEDGQHLIRLFGRQRHNRPDHTEIAEALQLLQVFRRTADGHWQRLGITSGLGGHLPKLRQVNLRITGTGIRVPAVAIAHRASGSPWKGAAEQHRRMRLLNRLRPCHHRIEIDELTVVLRLLLRPDFLHRLDRFAYPLEAGGINGAVIFHFVLVPAAANAKQKPSVADQVDRGDQLGGLDRVPLLNERHPGAEFDGLRGLTGRRQHHERVHGVVILFGQITASRERRLARQRNMRVLGRPD